MTNRQITISTKSIGGRMCHKCRKLTTEGAVARCSKGYEHFNANDCDDYSDASINTKAVFGGTTGIVLGGQT